MPTNQVLALGGTVSLSVTVSGAAPVYQWFKDNRLLLAATNNTLTVTNAGVTNSGTFYVVVTNLNGMVISQPASVMVGNSSLLVWGNNNNGELGNGTTGGTNLPIMVASNVVAGAAGAQHSLMVTSDGKVAQTARMFANHGQLKKHDHQIEGRNSRLDGLQAAVLR
ncbi:MAG: hypothetical protein RL616_1654, partial [Verrucomicrobiota bacterium]